MRGRGNVDAMGNIDAEQGSVSVKGREVTVNTVHAGENIKLVGLEDVGYEGGGIVDAKGLVSADNGDVDIMVKATPEELDQYKEPIYPESADYDPAGVIKLNNDVVAGGSVGLHNDTEFYADADQHVTAEDGMITAKGTLTKTSENGSLYLHADDDVRLYDDVVNPVGGVSVISDNGKIYTPDAEGGETDAINVGIEGSSDYLFDVGVDLPFGDGEAAIVLLSHDTIELGPDASLYASGFYLSTADAEAGNYDEPGVDDRPGAGLLQEDGAIIGGYERDEGIPSDIADLYRQCKSGDVIAQCRQHLCRTSCQLRYSNRSRRLVSATDSTGCL